jgi:hypothetical protein
MNLPTRVICVATLSASFCLAWPGVASALEVLSRGPVHEAFARPIERRPGATPAVPKEPPRPLIELLPEERPQGDSIRWIPGYWAWDSGRIDFVWVSGVFRQLPTGRQYLPGYWTKTEQVWRWVPGLWIGAQQKELTYLPEPPDSVEVGPEDAAPNENSIYLPGYWRYADDRFTWQPGRWEAINAGRVWVSPHYQWTPGGYLFVDGYEDYPLANRGQLFAPVAFARLPAHYRPVYAINLDTMLSTLFHVRGSYRFSLGDYFAPADISAGYQPWFSGMSRYDPLLAYYEWENRTDVVWLMKLQRSYDDRAAGRRRAPLRILEGQGGTAPAGVPRLR